jgi:hypothetical protein
LPAVFHGLPYLLHASETSPLKFHTRERLFPLFFVRRGGLILPSPYKGEGKWVYSHSSEGRGLTRV